MNKFYPLLAGTAFLSCSTLAWAGDSWLSRYHLIVSDQLKNVGEVEGRALVNNVSVKNSFSVGVNYSSDPSQVNLAIVGKLEKGGAIHLNSGSAYYGDQSFQKGNQWTLVAGDGHKRTLNMNSKGTVTGTAPLDYQKAFQGIASESQYLASLKSNSSLSYSGNAATFVVGKEVGNGVAVFSLTESDMNNLFVNGKTAQIEFNLNGVDPSAVVINVAGLEYSWNKAGNFVGLWTENKPSLEESFRSKVMWNFSEAEEITMNRGFYGTLLAPYATLKNKGGAMEGAVAVKNLDTNVEIHAPLFNGSFRQGSPVPEASGGAAAVALLGLGVHAGLRRRRAAN
jgi:choice-of-anchor A domain-containing protein